MKIVIAYEANETASQTGMNILVWPDSAMIRSGKPLFIPDSEMYLLPGFVARIKSVGKSIRYKFAQRYYDEITPAAFILPRSAATRIEDRQDPTANEIAADYSIICGDFTECARLYAKPESIRLDIEMARLGSSENVISESLHIENLEEIINQALVTAAVRNTVKTGDLTGFMFDKSFSVVPDTRLTMKIDGKVLMKNNLK